MESGLRLLVALCRAVAVPCEALQKSLAHVLWFFTLRWREQRQDMSSTPLSWEEGCAGGGAGLVFHARPKSHFRRKGQVAPRVSYSPPAQDSKSVS